MPTLKPVLAAFGLAVLRLATPACAQVINGESTYEDNFAHIPPSEPAQPAGPGARADGPRDPDPAKAERRRN